MEFEEKKDRTLERQQVLFTQTADCPLNVTSTISSPNVGRLIAAIAAILRSQIEEDSKRPFSTNPTVRIFDEGFYLKCEKIRKMQMIHASRLFFMRFVFIDGIHFGVF